MHVLSRSALVRSASIIGVVLPHPHKTMLLNPTPGASINLRAKCLKYRKDARDSAPKNVLYKNKVDE